MRLVFAIVFICASLGSFSQVGADYRSTAIQYYANEDYEKAAIYYLKLWEDTKSRADFEKYYLCLLELERYKEAEKHMKKEVKKKNTPLTMHILYGDLYAKQGLDDKANQLYDQAIKGISTQQTFAQVSQIANEFQIRTKIDKAIQTYEKGKKLNVNPVAYNIRIGELYGMQGKTDLMIREFLTMLETNEGYQNQVQHALTRSIDFKEDDKEVGVLKTELIKLTQKHPNKAIYNELLIWVFEQKGDFTSAFIQVKALDKKSKAKGRKVFEFGETCENNDEFDLAIKAYQYVIELGKDNRYYRSANYRSLNTLKRKITTSPNYTKEDLISLEQKYQYSLNDVGKAPHSINMMKDLGHLQGFYLQKFDESIAILEEALALASRTPKVEAEVKMLLADVLVIKGSIWDASLYYSQVDMDFKEDVLSHEAKYKNAKIFYYTANFVLAQSQLDVLKASTQKLIANDAMELSLLITDNLALDTTANTMRMFAEADLLIVQHRYEEALAKFDSINQALPYHSLNDEILMKKYAIDYQKQNYKEAAAHLIEIVAQYSEDILADNALYLLGDLHQNIFKDDAKAAEYYFELFTNYRGSMFGIEAKKRYRAIKGDSPNSGTFKEIE